MNRESVLMPTTGGYAGGLANKRLVSNPDLSNKLLSKRPNLSRPGLSNTFGGKPLQGKSLNNPSLFMKQSSLKGTFNLQPLLQSRVRPQTTNSVLDSLTKRVSTENTTLHFNKLRLEQLKTTSSSALLVNVNSKVAKKKNLMLVAGGSFIRETSVGRLSNPMLVHANLKRDANPVAEANELLVMEDTKVLALLNLDKIDRSCLSFKHRGMLPALYKSLTIQPKEGKQQQKTHERDDAWKKIFGDIDEVVQDLYTNREFYIDPSLMTMNFDVTEENTCTTEIHGLQEKMALLKLVSIALVDSPKYKLQDGKTQLILENLDDVVSIDPEFILKVALYARKDLNIRKMSNFILAFCATNAECKRYLKKYFRACINLPSDWIEVAELVSVFQPKNKKQVMPACLRKVMAEKFADFNEYQLAKYNKTASKKKKLPRYKRRDTPVGSTEDDDGDSLVSIDEGKGETFTMKQLVRKLHISKPAKHVMQLLGKKYPSSMDDYFSAGLSGEWDSALSGQRMKLPVPQTWETQCSQLGNKAHVWEKLIDERTLPYMACLRNIRNMIKAGISEVHHKKVLKWICNENAVANGKQFPIRYFSCYDILDELEITLKAQGAQLPTAPQRGRGRGRKVQNPPQWAKKRAEKKQEGVANLNYDLDLLSRYRKALNEAIEVAVRRNLPPIEGHTIIECYFDGEEEEPFG